MRLTGNPPFITGGKCDDDTLQTIIQAKEVSFYLILVIYSPVV